MAQIYRRNTDPTADADFAAARVFGKVRLGTESLFWRRGLRAYRLPLKEIRRAWRRVEEVRAKTGCCSNDFSAHFLMLRLADGTEEKIKIGEALYRHEPEALMEQLKAQCPDLPIGKPED